MDWLEQDLQSALARKDPPADFAGRVLQRAGQPARIYQWPRWLAVAAALVMASSAALGYRHYRGELAKEQVMQALRSRPPR